MTTTQNEKPLLVMDLDECMIHASGLELDRPCDFFYKNLRVYKRPHLDEFLRTASQHFRLALWSMGTNKYVQTISKQILPEGLEWDFVWSRKNCRKRVDIFWGGSFFYKTLDKLKRYGYALDKITMIDNNPIMIVYSQSKVITIKSFWGESDDKELIAFIDNCPNFESFTEPGGGKRQGHFLSGFLGDK